MKGRDLTLLGIRKWAKALIDELLSGVLVRLEVKLAVMHGCNKQIIAIDVDSSEHLLLTKLTDPEQEIEYGIDEVYARSHVDDDQRST